MLLQAAHTLRELVQVTNGQLDTKARVATLANRGITVSRSIASRAGSLLKAEKYGTHEDGFRGAFDLLRRVSDANPMAVTDLWLDPLPQTLQGTVHHVAVRIRKSATIHMNHALASWPPPAISCHCRHTYHTVSHNASAVTRSEPLFFSWITPT